MKRSRSAQSATRVMARFPASKSQVPSLTDTVDRVFSDCSRSSASAPRITRRTLAVAIVVAIVQRLLLLAMLALLIMGFFKCLVDSIDSDIRNSQPTIEQLRRQTEIVNRWKGER